MSPVARRLIASVTLLLALAVIAVLTLRAFGAPIAVGPLASPTPLPLPSPEPTPEASLSLEEALDAIEADVADLRDLRAADVEAAEFVTRAELERRLVEQFAEDHLADEVAAKNAFFRALGLLTAGQDWQVLRLQLLRGQVLGYYDDMTRSMVRPSNCPLPLMSIRDQSPPTAV